MTDPSDHDTPSSDHVRSPREHEETLHDAIDQATDTKRFTVRVPETIADALQAEANRRGLAVDALIRQILTSHIQDTP